MGRTLLITAVVTVALSLLACLRFAVSCLKLDSTAVCQCAAWRGRGGRGAGWCDERIQAAWGRPAAGCGEPAPEHARPQESVAARARRCVGIPAVLLCEEGFFLRDLLLDTQSAVPMKPLARLRCPFKSTTVQYSTVHWQAAQYSQTAQYHTARCNAVHNDSSQYAHDTRYSLPHHRQDGG